MNGLSKVVFAIHMLVISSVAWLAITLVLGGPLAIAATLAALLTEIRSWSDPSGPRPGLFGRLWRSATKRWTASLPALVPLVIVLGLVVMHFHSQSSVSLLLLIAGTIWSLMGLHHMILRLSLGLSAWSQPRRWLLEGLLCAWWHLLAICLWLGTVLVLFPLSPVLVILFAPALIAVALQRLETPVLRAITMLSGQRGD